MKGHFAPLLACILLAQPLCCICAEVTHPELRLRLLEMLQKDQMYRKAGADLDSQLLANVDEANLIELRQIIKRHGWPTQDMVGVDGAQAAFLLVQHAGSDKKFQRSILKRLESMAANNQIPPAQFAFLYDRLHRPQRYGTQGTCDSNGTFVPREIENPSTVNELRAKMSMQTLELYIRSASNEICKHAP